MLNIDFEQEDWMLEGGCVYSDTELFFPVGSSMKAMKQANEAKAICMECPVVNECLDYAIRTNQDSESGVVLLRKSVNQLEGIIVKLV